MEDERLTDRREPPGPSAMLAPMAHRPYPNRERAARQIDRHHSDVEPWAAVRPRDPELADDAAAGPGWAGEYRISTRQAVSPPGA